MSHWYNREGNPCYEVEKKKGGMRPSHLGDARKHGWVPSATSIWGDVIARPQLNNWIQSQLMQALWAELHSAAFSKDGGFETFEKLARNKYSKQQQVTMNRGTTIHDHLEIYFKGGDAPRENMFICDTVERKLSDVCGNGNWVAEASFAHASGYGGKIDLHNDDWVVDFKTKDFADNPDVKDMVYDDQGCQLAAYNQGLGGGRRLLNLFIDVKTGAVLSWEHEDVGRFQEMFNHALALWKLIKKYDPSFMDRRIL